MVLVTGAAILIGMEVKKDKVKKQIRRLKDKRSKLEKKLRKAKEEFQKQGTDEKRLEIEKFTKSINDTNKKLAKKRNEYQKLLLLVKSKRRGKRLDLEIPEITSNIFGNNPVNSRWRPYPWPEYENPLDTSSYVNMDGKKFIDLQNSKYLYQNKTKKKICINLDKCKKVELKNDRLKKEILHTEIRLEYLKNKNAKKLEKINSLKKEIDKKVINESMLILIIIISFTLIFIVRYYLKVLHRIKI